MPRLENWSVGNMWEGFQAPGISIQMRGMVYDDELNRFEDGEKITTSLLKEIDIKNNTAQTLNTKYILGEPSEDYLKWLEENEIPLYRD